MKIKHNEPAEDRLYRQNITLEYSRKSTPIIASLLITCIMAVSLVYNFTYRRNLEAWGLGDPYHCQECKTLGIACNEHKGYDAKSALNDKINKICRNYTIDTDITEEEQRVDVKNHIYSNGIFDDTCDFCIQGGEECYGCEYDRRQITEIICNINNDPVFQSKLCDNCWDLKYANCSYCRAMLEAEVKSKFS